MNLLLTGAFPYTKEQLDSIASLGYNISFIQEEREKAGIDFSETEAVVCNNLFLYNDISEFKKLRFIQLTSAGADRLPLDYISAHNIKLETALGVYSIPMAEWVAGKILEIYKHTSSLFVSQQQKKWQKERGLLELTGKKAAIIGFGSVGKETARRLKPFGVKLVAVDVCYPRPSDAALVDEFYLSELLNSVLPEADIVVLTTPLTPETRHMINAERLSLMKETAVLINVSRGEIVDESALVEILQKGKFLGVALDVFEKEPLPEENPLWSFPNVIVTPHNAFVSDLINDRLFTLICHNLKDLKCEM